MLNVLFAHGAHTVLVELAMPKPAGHVLLHKACPGVVTAPGSQPITSKADILQYRKTDPIRLNIMCGGGAKAHDYGDHQLLFVESEASIPIQITTHWDTYMLHKGQCRC